MKKHTLQVNNLNIGYQHKPIIEHINFNVFPGELIGVIGVNGSGKSTLLKSISNEIKPLKGNVLLRNKPIEAYDLKERAKLMGLVLANEPVNTNLSIAEVIALGRHPYTNWLGLLSQHDRKKVVEAAQLVNIQKPLSTPCRQLSDGQLQNVLIARVIAQETPLILLDEPTTHLDLFHKLNTIRLLKRICKEKQHSILFATHEINLALQLCDQILVINNHKCHFGTPQKLSQNGVLGQLFPSEMINFDPDQLIFKL